MDFRNSTELDAQTLHRLYVQHTRPYRHDKLVVRVRYSRGADFSGTCYYTEARILVNLGRHVTYPYRLGTHIARSKSNRTHWWRETYRLVVKTRYELALFVYLHELYHFLVFEAGRNPRRKEAMCDRFAVRALVDHHGCRVVDRSGRRVPREAWDFQDVEAFVAGAPRDPAPTLFEELLPARPRKVPVRILGLRAGTRPKRSDT